MDIKERVLESNSIVLCSFGDASVNHASALSAFNTAAWIHNLGGHVPIIFLCEDNGTGISVPTQDGWIEQNFSRRTGIKYIKADWTNRNEDIAIGLAKYERSGIPLYIFWKPGMRNSKILPGVLTEDLLIRSIQ